MKFSTFGDFHAKKAQVHEQKRTR